jgi:hypothetical protein
VSGIYEDLELTGPDLFEAAVLVGLREVGWEVVD